MFHNHVRIDIVHLHLIQNRVQSQKNSQGCILHLIFPSPLPIVVLSWLCLVSWAFWLVVWLEASAVGLLSMCFCRWGGSTSFFWALQKGQSGPQPHFAHLFWVLLLEEALLL